MHASRFASILLAAVMLTACGDDDGGASEESVDSATSAYCDLVEESLEVQNEVGSDGPTSEQQQRMLDIAMRLQDEAPADLRDAYKAVEQLSADASGQERADALSAYSEAVNEWTTANCA